MEQGAAQILDSRGEIFCQKVKRTCCLTPACVVVLADTLSNTLILFPPLFPLCCRCYLSRVFACFAGSCLVVFNTRVVFVCVCVSLLCTPKPKALKMSTAANSSPFPPAKRSRVDANMDDCSNMPSLEPGMRAYVSAHPKTSSHGHLQTIKTLQNEVVELQAKRVFWRNESHEQRKYADEMKTARESDRVLMEQMQDKCNSLTEQLTMATNKTTEAETQFVQLQALVKHACLQTQTEINQALQDKALVCGFTHTPAII